MSQFSDMSLDEFGHILIPEHVRERLHLSPGMTLVVEQGEQGELHLRLQDEGPPLVEKDGVLVARVKAIGDLSDVTRHERDRRVFDLLQRVNL